MHPALRTSAARLSGFVSLALAPLLQPAFAHADPLSPAPGLSGPIGAPPDAGAHVHDGFYLRVAQGLCVYDEHLLSDTLPSGGEVQARNRGIASVSDLSIGGTVAPGWVIGGTISSLDLVASTLRIDGNDVTLPDELDPGIRNMALIGAFVDWYPNVRGGFHAQAALGLSTLTARVIGHPATERSEYIALGGGLLIGTGYEWWIADEWSLGVLGQLGIRVMGGDAEAGDGPSTSWTHVVISSPTFALSLTYH